MSDDQMLSFKRCTILKYWCFRWLVRRLLTAELEGNHGYAAPASPINGGAKVGHTAIACSPHYTTDILPAVA